MSDSPSIPVRLMFWVIRGLLVVATLAIALVAGGVFVIPLMIAAPPLPIILAGLLALYVLGATSSMADDWHARHARRRRGPPEPAPSRAGDRGQPAHADVVVRGGAFTAAR